MEGGKRSHSAFGKNAESFFSHYFSTMSSWRVGNFILSSYVIRGRYFPQVKKLLFTHLSHTMVWSPGTVINNNHPFHMCIALHFTKWIRIQEWGFWNQSRFLSPALPLLSGPVTLPLRSLLFLCKYGVSDFHITSFKWRLSAIVCLMFPGGQFLVAFLASHSDFWLFWRSSCSFREADST